MHATQVAIIGAGPAGLTAGYLLSKQNIGVRVLEADPEYVGGLSRTVQYKGYYFDIGGHRFFSKAKEVEDFWSEILGDDMLERPRKSQIYYRGQLFSYPLKGPEALRKLGIVEATRCVLSYLYAQARPIQPAKSFEDWVTNQFGKRLFSIFFKTYTEKVWGMSCKEISADWAAQRIKGLSLKTAIKEALLPSKPKTGSDVIKTLIHSFRYPRKGPGMMWERCAEKVKQQGGAVELDRRVTGCQYHAEDRSWTVTTVDGKNNEETVKAQHLISSAPMQHLAKFITPDLAGTARAAAESLRYRDFLTVALMLKDRGRFDDNWIYIHDPSVLVGRIQNYKSWSPEMVPEPENTCYGLEYFCFEGDGLWNSADADLIERGKKELEQIGLGSRADILDGCVVRMKKAYPVYDDHYADHVEALRDELESRFPTLHLVGRNGMHKYNNQDHAMMTAMLTVKNIVAGSRVYDVWNVNQDAEYHEAGAAGDNAAGGLRMVPQRVEQEPAVPANSSS